MLTSTIIIIRSLLIVRTYYIDIWLKTIQIQILYCIIHYVELEWELELSIHYIAYHITTMAADTQGSKNICKNYGELCKNYAKIINGYT